jgi:hypothetical protein
MAAAYELEPCKCGGPRTHHRRAGHSRALCGLVVAGEQARFDEPECLNCARRKKEIERFAPAPSRFQLATIARGRGVHLVAVRPSSPEWTAPTTLCGKTVDALMSFDAAVSCERCKTEAVKIRSA